MTNYTSGCILHSTSNNQRNYPFFCWIYFYALYSLYGSAWCFIDMMTIYFLFGEGDYIWRFPFLIGKTRYHTLKYHNPFSDMSKHIIIIHKVINMFYNNDLLPQLLVDAWSYDDSKKIDFIYYMILFSRKYIFTSQARCRWKYPTITQIQIQIQWNPLFSPGEVPLKISVFNEGCLTRRLDFIFLFDT